VKYFILNGPSAAGKTALLDFVLHNNNDCLEPIISFTTRQPRFGEKYGRDYYFITKEKYSELQKDNQIVEQIKYLDHNYGVTAQELKRVEDTRKNGIAIMTLEGIRMLKENVGYQKVISIFIYRDLTSIAESINELYPNKSEADQRFEMAKREMRDISSCDHVVYNIASLTDADRQLLNIIKKEINSRSLEQKIIPGQKFRHFSGQICEVVCELAENTETLSPMVVYRNLNTGQLRTRPYELFCGKKEWPSAVNGIIDRFELVK